MVEFFKKLTLKHWLILGLLFLILGLAVFYILRFKDSKKTPISLYEYIPQNSTLIIETSHIYDVHEKLNGSSILWADLLSVPFWKNINHFLIKIDSLNKSNAKWNEVLDQKYCISLFEEKNETQFLLALEQSDEFDLNLITSILGPQTQAVEPLQVQQEAVYKIKTAASDFYFFQYKNICLISSSHVIIEQALLSKQSKLNLANSVSFKSTQNLAGSDLDFNIYFNFQEPSNVAEQFFNAECLNRLSALKKLKGWIVIDGMIKPNLLTFNGFIEATDSAAGSLNKQFYKQWPVKQEVISILPENTEFFIYEGFSDFQSYLNNNKQGNTFDTDSFQSMIENELLLGACKAGANSHLNFAIVKSNDPPNLITFLKAHSIKAAHDSVYELKNHSLLKNLAGDLFKNFKTNYFSAIDNYLVFFEELQTASYFDQNKLQSHNLSTNAKFQGFSEHFSDHSNLFLFLKPSGNVSLWKHWLNKSSLKNLTSHFEIVDKMEYFAIQITHDENNRFYLNSVLKYTASNTKSPSLLWDFKPEAEVSMKPFIFSNHTNGLKDIFFQDNNHQIYLLSATGKLFWKKKLDDKIVGRIYEVDALKNNKFQLLFCTKNKLYLIDRNGKDLSGYPVILPSETVSGLTLFDYDKTREYRIMIPCKNKKIYNYQITGKNVEGWAFQGASGELNLDIKNTVSDGKDFIITIDKNGQIYGFDRRGNPRLNIQERVILSENNSFFIRKSENTHKSAIVYSDNVGNINTLFFDGTKQTYSIKNFNEDHFFIMNDINNDKKPDYLFAEKNNIRVYDDQKNVLLDYHSEKPISSSPQIFWMNERPFIGFVNSESNEINLINTNGQLIEAFPLEGNAPFAIQNINNDQVFNLIVATKNGTIRVYSLDNLEGMQK